MSKSKYILDLYNIKKALFFITLINILHIVKKEVGLLVLVLFIAIDL